ncbi:toll/interleukin-1 receptor domain-containing protein [Aquimarina megaterium]|uniref:toll/interleukin-1 receptor domain-containing protein n=1 Tax=Aquimarina megaterium TaxID=1443666 RepID=UPI000944821D|nr:toll/interleukin-1 receptor domain-containing protein [Aquimarina megaterium]
MTALNRYYWPTKFDSRNSFLNQNVKCVFISYQNNDKAEAKKIADYLISAGINVYFDEYDGDLKRSNQNSSRNKVTESLCKGINNSSYMIVIVSPSTMESNWVPFEIGFGYDKTELSVLTLKGIPKGSLPEYLQTVYALRNIWRLNGLIETLKGTSRKLLLETNSIKEYNNYNHPLNEIMDSILIDN